MAEIISFANQKGGVGKSTSAINVSAGLAAAGKKTLLVDFDPQGNATSGLGINKKNLTSSVYELIISRTDAKNAVLATKMPGLYIIPASISLAGAEFELVDVEEREFCLKKALESVKNDFDYIIIDCPPSLGLLTLNALTASDGAIVPMLCEHFSLEGLTQLLMTVRAIKKRYNERLRLIGILITMFNGRLSLSQEVLAELKRYYSDKLFRTLIPRNVRLAEAPGFGEPIQVYDKRSKGAEAYNDVALEIIERTGV